MTGDLCREKGGPVGKRVTILDVAEEAGVSRQTVTRAMNDMSEISAATRRRVLEAADRLGYRPSRYARNLVTRQKAHALGLVVPSLRNPYYTEMAADLLSAAAERRWQVVIAAPEGDVVESLALLSTQVDVIAGYFRRPDADLVEIVRGLPVVRLGRERSEPSSAVPGVHAVDTDLESGIVDAVAALRERGARRFGMVDSAHRSGGPYTPSPRREWFEEATGGELTGVVAGEESISGGGEAFAALLRQHPDTDAVLMFNDLMALGAVQTARALRVDVPGGVRVVGVDGLALGEAVDPPLTSISLDRRGLAEHILDIIQILADADFARLPPIRRSVRATLLTRGSA
ncbi:LacI family DNA-binding transcriptional regulator [Myceligenerans pegani]|uniref:LacI family DNA-binding transcriptional regulator n=1 Tax=Myceligenerans pegani TaxID=2776917 RepID=A0ABR9MZA0_9MICO|nr:LacI family DNA-binding transcriptional regulator [Myceligenerans sp. TRM 65318]MBE1876709.1 LacI family DNA-binding transcriptional regulator [Myceligenerans sp. TRM 65318]MBE3018980.1 LacI family DNA-binding transcriptional regulator [Myceligenerans sp. TRM 65318]